MSENKEVIELNFKFFNETTTIRCPVANKKKLEAAVSELQKKLEQDNQAKFDKYNLLLMTCLKYAFQEEIQKDEINGIISVLEEVKAQLFVNNASSVEDNNKENTAKQQTSSEKKVREYINTEEQNSIPTKIPPVDEQIINEQTVNEQAVASSIPSTKISEEKYGKLFPAATSSDL
jgi:hypothetical protein